MLTAVWSRTSTRLVGPRVFVRGPSLGRTGGALPGRHAYFDVSDALGNLSSGVVLIANTRQT
eukprot:46283-Pyramimonas_sp.AAC.1